MASLENLSEEQIKSLASLAKDLSDDPATRRKFQKLIKEKNPATIFPELEVDERVEAVAAKMNEETEAMRAELKTRDLELRRKELRQDLSAKYPGITFDEIEEAMVKSSIGSHETAAQYLANQRMLSEPAPEVPGRGGPMMMPSEAKQFFRNPTQVARKLANDVMTDLVSKRNRARIGA
jgi:hypothetical protein